MWIVRRWQYTLKWFTRQSSGTRLLLTAAALAVVGSIAISGIWPGGWYDYLFRYSSEDREFIRRGRDGYSSGLPSLARKLYAEVKTIPDPETAQLQNSDWFGVRFKNGEWLFGHGIDSHSMRLGRGTLVLKDSRGRVRVFFGHVCGPNAGIHLFARDMASLYDIDLWLSKTGMLREWFPN